MNSRHQLPAGTTAITPGLLFAAALCALPLTQARAEDLKLKNGKTYVNITAVTDGGDKVRVTHDSGIAAVAKKDVPADFLTAHGVSLDATPPPSPPPAATVTTTAPASAAGATALSGQQTEERKLTALSILGPRAIPVELSITNYENDTFVGQAAFIEMKSEQRTVNRDYNALERRMITDTINVGVPEKWHLIAPLRVYGLPKSLALGPKVYQGYLWIGWMRNKEREAFVTKELAVKHMVERGPGDKVKQPEFVEQTQAWMKEHGLWLGPDTVIPKPSF